MRRNSLTLVIPSQKNCSIINEEFSHILQYSTEVYILPYEPTNKGFLVLIG
jgi:hypothetical protein